MGYYNPIHAYGTARFARDAAAAGVDGLIMVDLPPEEDEVLRVPAKAQGMDMIRLVTPTTDDARLQAHRSMAPAAISIMSPSPASPAPRASPKTKCAPPWRGSAQPTDLPCAVGFGIRTPEQAAAIAAHRRWGGGGLGHRRPDRRQSERGGKRHAIVAEVLEFCRALGRFHACAPAPMVRCRHELDHQFRPPPDQGADGRQGRAATRRKISGRNARPAAR